MIGLVIAHMVGVGLMVFDVVCVVSTLSTIGVNTALTNTDGEKKRTRMIAIFSTRSIIYS